MTFNPLHNGNSKDLNLYILAVMRSSDKVMVAYSNRSREVTIEGIRECVAGNSSIQAGKRYTSQGQAQCIHYTRDYQGRVFAVVSSPRYSPRIAFALLDEFQSRFNAELGPRVPTALENGLSKMAQGIFKEMFEKYEEPAKLDKLVAVQGKIDVVKTTMKDNIQQLLVSTEKLEKIDEATKRLNEQAIDFNRGAKDLSNKMWWKMWKMRLLIGGLITAVLIIIIVPIAVSSSSSSSKSK